MHFQSTHPTLAHGWFVYRFRAGSSGVFVGAKDLHILDVSGSFLLAASRSDGKSGNENMGKLRLRLGGTSVQ